LSSAKRIVIELAGNLSVFAAAIVGVLFVGAGAAKLEGLQGWAGLVRRFPFSTGLKRLVLVGVPVAEIAVGISAFVRPPVGLALAALLLLVFSAAIARYFGSLAGAECRCFGNVGRSHIGPLLLGRNVTLALVAVGGAFAAWRSDAPSASPLEVATVGLLAFVVFLLVEYRALPKLEGVGGLPSPVEGQPLDE
jgi:hypothetical protein